MFCTFEECLDVVLASVPQKQRRFVRQAAWQAIRKWAAQASLDLGAKDPLPDPDAVMNTFFISVKEKCASLVSESKLRQEENADLVRQSQMLTEEARTSRDEYQKMAEETKAAKAIYEEMTANVKKQREFYLKSLDELQELAKGYANQSGNLETLTEQATSLAHKATKILREGQGIETVIVAKPASEEPN